jgi:hypothetical protein
LSHQHALQRLHPLALPTTPPHPTTQSGNTALHLAADRGRLPTVALLLDRGADHHVRNALGLSPLDVAAHRSNNALVRLIEARTCPFFAQLEYEKAGFFATSWDRRWVVVHRARPWDNPAVPRAEVTVLVYYDAQHPRWHISLRQPELRPLAVEGGDVVVFELASMLASVERRNPKSKVMKFRCPRPYFTWLSNVLSSEFPSGRGPGFDPSTGGIAMPPEAAAHAAGFASGLLSPHGVSPARATPIPAPPVPVAGAAAVRTHTTGMGQPLPAPTGSRPAQMAPQPQYRPSMPHAVASSAAIVNGPMPAYAPAPGAPAPAMAAASGGASARIVHLPPVQQPQQPATAYGRLVASLDGLMAGIIAPPPASTAASRPTGAPMSQGALAAPVPPPGPYAVPPAPAGSAAATARPTVGGPTGAAAAAAAAAAPSSVRSPVLPDLDALTFDADPPSDLLCPVTLELMVDPVILVGDGHTYSRAGIEEWLRHKSTSPKTNQRLAAPEDTRCVPNYLIRSQVLEWIDRHTVRAGSAASSSAVAATRAGAGDPSVQLQEAESAGSLKSAGATNHAAAVASAAPAVSMAASAPPAPAAASAGGAAAASAHGSSASGHAAAVAVAAAAPLPVAAAAESPLLATAVPLPLSPASPDAVATTAAPAPAAAATVGVAFSPAAPASAGIVAAAAGVEDEDDEELPQPVRSHSSAGALAVPVVLVPAGAAAVGPVRGSAATLASDRAAAPLAAPPSASATSVAAAGAAARRRPHAVSAAEGADFDPTSMPAVPAEPLPAAEVRSPQSAGQAAATARELVEA